MSKGQQVRYRNDHQKLLAGLLRDVARTHRLEQVWRDFVAMCALSLSNVADLANREKREAEYMAIVGRYEKEEVRMLAGGLQHVVNGLEDGHHDFLGSLFMTLDLGDSWKGQFFTPYELCELMAQVQMTGVEDVIKANGFARVSDPCVGGGAMLIAAAHVMLKMGINPQKHLHAFGQDVDLTAVHMSYVQLTLLHIPALIIHGNSLTMEVRSEWRTFAHSLGRWDWKLERQRQAEAGDVEPKAEDPQTNPAAKVDTSNLFTASPDAVRFAATPQPGKATRPVGPTQIKLF